MVYLKRYFIEITTLEPITTDKVYLSLSENFKQSFIEIFAVEDSFTYRSVKNDNKN